jgi:hypothetical protein
MVALPVITVIYVLSVPLSAPVFAVTVIVTALFVAPGASVTWKTLNVDGHVKSVQSESFAIGVSISLGQAAESLFFIVHV